MADVEPTYEIVSRKEAKTKGLRHYFTGKPCKRGHIDIRFTNNLTCYACIRERLNRFAKENPQVVKEWTRKSHKKNLVKYRPKRNEYARKWRQINLGKAKDAIRKYSLKNAVKLREKAVQYYWKNPEMVRDKARHRYRENPEKYKELAKQYRILNPEKFRAAGANRRALKRRAGGKHTDKDILEIIESQNRRCAYCRIKLKKYHVDHIVPITKGGTNDRKNLQILCQPCNQAKYNHDPMDYARRLGRLL